MSNEAVDDGGADRERQKSANTLSGAAATALALIASVFTSLPWRSPGSWLCASSLILLVALSGDDIRAAMRVSIAEGLSVRSGLGFLVIAILLIMFILDQLGE